MLGQRKLTRVISICIGFFQEGKGGGGVLGWVLEGFESGEHPCICKCLSILFE